MRRSNAFVLTQFDRNGTIQHSRLGVLDGNCTFPIACLCSPSDGYFWTLGICEISEATMSGRFQAQLLRLKASDLWEQTRAFRTSTESPIAFNDDAVAALFCRPILEVLAADIDAHEPIWPTVDRSRWRLAPYSRIVGELASEKVPATVRRYPFAVVAALADDHCIVGTYMCRRIAWLDLRIMDKARAPEPPPIGPENKFVVGPLEWKSLGLTETAIETWSSGFWIDNSLHVVSDDGKYERFKLRENAMVRVGQLSELSPPAAICQGQRHLWLLSETKSGSIGATEIRWNADDKLIRTDRDLGEISMDQAAVRVLATEREGK
ncbi:MAG: hypothetical protein JNG90_15380 [Planctomycetaceae bacterium]|nr:hypothetical protein [Planctomycetaceae bacterium]